MPKTCTYRSTKIPKTSENSTYQSESQKVYAYMARISSNQEILRRYFGDSSELKSCIFYSGTTFHITSDI